MICAVGSMAWTVSRMRRNSAVSCPVNVRVVIPATVCAGTYRYCTVPGKRRLISATEHALAQEVLLHFAEGVAGQGLHEVDGAGLLEGGELVPAEGDEGIGGEVGIVAYDHGGNLLAEL